MILQELKQLGAVFTEGKPILLKFWDENCPACIEEIPSIMEQYKLWSTRINFIGVSMSEKGLNETVLQRHGITWPQIHIPWGHSIVDELQVNSLPTSILLDNTGQVAIFDLTAQIKTVINNLHSVRPIQQEQQKIIANIEQTRKIIVKDAGLKGAGVFATEKINANEIIETCHIIDVPEGALKNYEFLWQERWGSKMVIPLGFGCIYNHSEIPNATWRQHSTAYAMEFIAMKDILPGEEICTYYGPEAYWQAKGITPIP